MWRFLILVPVLAMRPARLKEDERGTDITMVAKVKYCSTCSMFSYGDYRVLKVVVKDLNTPSTYYKKFEWDMSGMQTKKDFAVATLLKDVPDAADIEVQAYVKQWGPPAFWHLCGKKKAKLSFLPGSKVHEEEFEKDVTSANYYYQLVELLFEKSSEPERVITLDNVPREEIHSNGKEITQDLSETEDDAKDGITEPAEYLKAKKEETSDDEPEPEESLAPPSSVVKDESEEDVDTVHVPEETPETVPEMPKTVPETPKTVPETPETVPETPETVPETPKMVPETPEAVPEMPKTVPETPKTVPETPETVPETSETVPETPKMVPETPETVPEMPKTVPETPKTVPETPETVPETPKTVPEVPETVQESTEGTESTEGKNCFVCAARIELGLEDMIRPDAVELVISAGCGFDDCGDDCEIHHMGLTFSCAEDKTHRRSVQQLEEMAKKTAEKVKSIEEKAPEEEREKAMEAEEKAASQEEELSTMDPKVVATKECRKPSKHWEGFVNGGLKRSELHALGVSVKKEETADAYMKEQCEGQESGNPDFKCTGTYQKLGGYTPKQDGRCNFDEWMRRSMRDSWSEDCPHNRWRLCAVDERCKGEGYQHLYWGTCLAVPV